MILTWRRICPPPTPRPPRRRRSGTAACCRGDGDPAVVLDAGGENVIVVLGEDAGDAGAIWNFIRQRMTGQNTGLM